MTSTTVGVDQLRWPGVQQILRLERTTVVKGKSTETVQYAITSRSPRDLSATEALTAWRGRWGIENSVFYVRDEAFGEDRCRVRLGTAPLALARIRNAALNFLRAHRTTNITATLRQNALRLDLLFAKLNIPYF